MKSLIVHYKNKYPNAQVTGSEDRLDVFSVHGKHLVALRKNGAGQIVDFSEQLGCEERHDLSPIVKESRLKKLCAKTGCIINDELCDERAEACKKDHAKFFAKKEGYSKAYSLKEAADAEKELAKKKFESEKTVQA